jgi:hypothetical protein
MKTGIALALSLVIGTATMAFAQQHHAGKSPMPMPPPAPKMTKAMWQKMYDMAETYFNKKDADKIFSFMAPGATMVMEGKEMSMKDGKAGMKQWFSMMKTLKCDITVTSATQNGNMATVKDTFKDMGIMIDPKTKKEGKYAGIGMETMTWTWMNGKWMIKRLVIDSNKMTLNGKPMKGGM